MKISRQILWLLILFPSALVTLSTYANETDSSNDISFDGSAIIDELLTMPIEYHLTALIENHLEQYAQSYAEKGYRSDISVGNIDPYHRVKTCNTQPILSVNRPPLEQNRITTEVKCEGSKPWKLFVSSQFDLYAPTVVAAGNIRRGQVITAHDLILKESAINRSHYTLYHELEAVTGMVAKRSIRAESAILPSQLIPPKLVKRGDNVVIVAKNNAISVRMTGTALSDGALGQQIAVRNLQSKRVVKARVSEAGLVTILL